MSAQWIWADDAIRENAWVRFRKRFTASAGAVRVRVAVDSKYWLWLNGQLIVREGGLKRGPTPRDTYVDTVELPLAAGENTLAILAWYWGGVTAGHNDSGRGGLFVDGPGIASDASWRESVHPAFGPSDRPLFNNTAVLPEFPVNFDAGRDEPEWMQPAFDDRNWASAIEAGAPPCEPWGELVDRPIPQWRDSEVREYESIERDGQRFVGKLPSNLQVYPRFQIVAPPGLTVAVKIERDRKTSEYITGTGIQEFEVPVWGNGHRVTYDFAPNIKVLRIDYRETGYDCDFAGQFDCDDEALNTLWCKAARSTYLNMRDTYMDCPDRERQPWPNDAVPMMEQAFYAFDRRADALFGKMIREFVDWRTSDGVLWGPVPTGRFRGSHRELAAITLAMIRGMWTYYVQSSDEATIDHAYPAVRDYLVKHWHVDPIELVRHRGPSDVQWGPGTQNWYDWGPNQDWRLLDNCWLAAALQAAMVFGNSRRDPAGTGAMADMLRPIIERFHSVFWRGTHYASPGHQGPPDERGNAMAVLLMHTPRECYPAIRDVILAGHNASIYMERYCVEALFRMGYADDAIRRIKQRFAAEIASPYSTLPEAFGEQSNHGWGGWVLPMIVRYIAGVPEMPSEHLILRPCFGHLEWLDITVPQRNGQLMLRYARTKQTAVLDIHLPPGITGELFVPLAGWCPRGLRVVELNGQQIIDAASPTTDYRRAGCLWDGQYRIRLDGPQNQLRLLS